MKRTRQTPAASMLAPPAGDAAGLFQRVAGILDEARRQTVRSVNTWMVTAYWLIGREIVEVEQGGKERAKYGANLLKNLSSKLTQRFGKGFSVQSLENFRNFFLTYSDRSSALLCPSDQGVGPQLSEEKSSTSWRISRNLPVQPKSSTFGRILSAMPEPHLAAGQLFHPNLGWSHYRALMRVEKSEARQFYEEEAINGNWSVRQLERQITTLYYERLLASSDKRGMLKEQRATSCQSPHPLDIIKDPYVLEFLNLPESHQLSETDLELTLISHLQSFLLELGNGFAFVGRQQRLTLEGDHFYADLVFYHVRLKCYVIIDLKTRKLDHADLGQMQLYVNYYDREIAAPDDNPTLGLILCTDKNDAVVRYVLDKSQEKIFASRYRMELPSEAALVAEVRREMAALGLDTTAAEPAKARTVRKTSRKKKTL